MHATGSQRVGRFLFPYLCLLPATALVVGVLFIPIAQTFVNSVFDLDRYGNRAHYIGLQNYRETFADAGFLYALKNTAIWTTAVVLFTLVISLITSLFLHRKFAFRRIARAILVLPWASALVISAILWRYIFDSDVGPFNVLLLRLHLVEEPIRWLGTREYSFPVMMAVAIFVSIPFTTTVFLAGLQGIPGELYEAGRVDGASPRGLFWHVTLPHLRDVFAIATVINVIYVFNSFPIVWTMTGGGPFNSTDIAMTYLYKKAFTDNQFALASAQAVIIFICLLSFSALYSYLVRRGADE